MISLTIATLFAGAPAHASACTIPAEKLCMRLVLPPELVGRPVKRRRIELAEPDRSNKRMKCPRGPPVARQGGNRRSF